MPTLNLLQTAKADQNTDISSLLEEVIPSAPEFNHLPVRTIPGGIYETLVRAALPVTAFLAASQGIDVGESKYDLIASQCACLGGRVEIPRTILESAKGATPDELKRMEALGVFESALRTAGRQIFYGVAASEKGFPGLPDYVTAEMTVDAGGNAANEGSSVYLAKLGERNIQLIMGRGTTFELGEWRLASIDLPDGKVGPGETASLAAWIGLQCTNPRSVARIKNLTEQTAKGLTPALLNRAIEAFPSGAGPDVIFMSPRSLRQLRDAAPELAAVLHSSKPMYAGLPICDTDSIINTEVIG